MMASTRERADIDGAWQPFEPTTASPFDASKARHLLTRAAFGGTTSEVDRLVPLGPIAAVDSLFSPEGADQFESEADAMIRTSLVLGDTNNLVDWWLYRMLGDPYGVREKATFFWHGHFCTSRDKVPDSQLLLAQNNTLRQNALGSFVDLVKAISRDAAMLIYLDSTENRKNRPNENFARELLELFCLGLGNYSEHDVKELARCFTGWEVRRRRFRISQSDHDSGVKKMLGSSGAFDGDQAIDVILKQPEAARFVAAKLIRFYITEDDIPEPVVQGLAEKLVESEWNLEPVLKTIFRSQLFFSHLCRNRKVAGPVAWTVAWLRALESGGNLDQLRGSLESMGQVPLEPPNVKGWPGGTSWIDPSRMATRVNWSQRLAADLLQPPGGLNTWLAKQQLSSANDVVRWVQQNLITGSIASSRENVLRDQIAKLPSTNEQFKMAIRVAGIMPEAHII